MTYRTSKMLEDCLNARPHKIDGREVDTKRAMPRSVSYSLCNNGFFFLVSYNELGKVRYVYSKTCLKRPLKKKTKIGFQD